jgi:adenine-specific DNA-methyltransferase
MSVYMPAGKQLALFEESVDVAGAVQCAVMDEPIESRLQDSHKALGAYYTDSQIAEFLVWWAVRGASDTVLDPAFGGGVFLRAACRRLREIGGDPAMQVFGVEVDASVHRRIAEKLQEDGVASSNLLASDFFATNTDRMRCVDAIVGNPPFIRYQRFSGDMRRRALARAAEQGLKLSGLSSSWLPFLVHSIRFLRPGGRIAMVIPFEIGHAAYAVPVLRHLDRMFESVTFLTFRKKLFPELSQDTILLLAEGRDRPPRGHFSIRDVEHAGVLADIQAASRRPLGGLRHLDRERVASGHQRLIEYLLPRQARELYAELRDACQTTSLGEIADVGIGYVTGANDFFHVGPGVAADCGFPSEYLRACVRRGRALAGLRFTKADWNAALASGDAGYLLDLPANGILPPVIASYIRDGERRGIHTAFKCRTRSPWYRVPHVYMPDAFLTYMSGDLPRLVANDSGVVAPNTLHVLRLHRGVDVSRDALAALWQTSLTRLSAEIEGHSLGGGMLKLEPTEAERVMVPFAAKKDNLDTLAAELDQVARSRGDEACASLADQHLLRRRLGLSAADVRLLRDSALLLRERRIGRSVLDERR